MEWRNLLKDGWLPATKVAGWISGGLLEPSIPLRSRVVAFRCVREVFGEEEQVMAEIAYQLIASSKQSDTKQIKFKLKCVHPNNLTTTIIIKLKSPRRKLNTYRHYL